MRQLQEHPDMWQRVDAILETSSSSNSKFFALQVRLRRTASAAGPRWSACGAAGVHRNAAEPPAGAARSVRAELPQRKRGPAAEPGRLARRFSSFPGLLRHCTRLRGRWRPAGCWAELCAAREDSSPPSRPPPARPAPHPSAPPQVLESVIKYRWMSLPAEQREGIKNYIASVVIKARRRSRRARLSPGSPLRPPPDVQRRGRVPQR